MNLARQLKSFQSAVKGAATLMTTWTTEHADQGLPAKLAMPCTGKWKCVLCIVTTQFLQSKTYYKLAAACRQVTSDFPQFGAGGTEVIA
eukprot:4809312-Pleurochrysis_carterae.AAC.3